MFIFLDVSASFSPCTSAVLPTKAPDPEFVHYITPLLRPLPTVSDQKPTYSTPHADLTTFLKPLRMNYTLQLTDVAGISPAHAHLLDRAAPSFRLLPTGTLGASTKNKVRHWRHISFSPWGEILNLMTILSIKFWRRCSKDFEHGRSCEPSKKRK